MSALDTIDVTEEKLMGPLLREEIDGRHAASQALVVRPYPHILRITSSQYEDLMKQSGVPVKYGDGSEEQYQLYKTVTGYLMEVDVIPDLQ